MLPPSVGSTAATRCSAAATRASRFIPGDWPVALAAFDAQVDTFESPRRAHHSHRSRCIASRETRRTSRRRSASDELVVRIRVPATPLGRASTYHKIRDRESYAFALASAAVALDMDGDTVREARIALGGVATRPWRAREAERALAGRALNDATARAAGDAAFAAAKIVRDNAYKIELGARTVADALMIARGRIRGS